jgi:anti-anti-sigma regulatory factor
MRDLASFAPAAESYVVLPADFDDAAAAGVQAQLGAALHSGASRIRLDFARIERISAGGLALLTALVQEVGESEVAPLLIAEGVSQPVGTLFRVTGLHRAMTPAPD